MHTTVIFPFAAARPSTDTAKAKVNEALPMRSIVTAVEIASSHTKADR
jgi:hypothetical protein